MNSALKICVQIRGLLLKLPALLGFLRQLQTHSFRLPCAYESGASLDEGNHHQDKNDETGQQDQFGEASDSFFGDSDGSLHLRRLYGRHAFVGSLSLGIRTSQLSVAVWRFRKSCLQE